MITLEEMKNLAMLARVGVPDDELAQVAQDFDAILGYVDQINKAEISDVDDAPLQVNSVREDANANESVTYFDVLIADAPDSQDGFYKVPKIL
jgi:aspartyl-tRNA(Asn)/glutamyl-tRNA(Gln) amidotransferase subunit C